MIADQLANIDEKSDPEAWATLETCLSLNNLLEIQLIPNPEGNLPGLYMACGKVFGDNGRYGEASTMYLGGNVTTLP